MHTNLNVTVFANMYKTTNIIILHMSYVLVCLYKQPSTTDCSLLFYALVHSCIALFVYVILFFT